MQTRDDTSDVSGFTRVSNLTAPRQWRGGDRAERVKALHTKEEEIKMEEEEEEGV